MNGHWKYIDTATWELVTKVDGVEIHRTNDLNKVARHCQRVKALL